MLYYDYIIAECLLNTHLYLETFHCADWVLKSLNTCHSVSPWQSFNWFIDRRWWWYYYCRWPRWNSGTLYVACVWTCSEWTIFISNEGFDEAKEGARTTLVPPPHGYTHLGWYVKFVALNTKRWIYQAAATTKHETHTTSVWILWEILCCWKSASVRGIDIYSFQKANALEETLENSFGLFKSRKGIFKHKSRKTSSLWYPAWKFWDHQRYASCRFGHWYCIPNTTNEGFSWTANLWKQQTMRLFWLCFFMQSDNSSMFQKYSDK